MQAFLPQITPFCTWFAYLESKSLLKGTKGRLPSAADGKKLLWGVVREWGIWRSYKELGCLPSDWHPHSEGNLCSLGICCQLFIKAQKCCGAVLGARICPCAVTVWWLLTESLIWSCRLSMLRCRTCVQIQCCVWRGYLASGHLGMRGPHLPLPGKDHVGHHLLPAPNTQEDLSKDIHPVVTLSYTALTSHVGNAWD